MCCQHMMAWLPPVLATTTALADDRCDAHRLGGPYTPREDDIAQLQAVCARSRECLNHCAGCVCFRLAFFSRGRPRSSTSQSPAALQCAPTPCGHTAAARALRRRHSLRVAVRVARARRLETSRWLIAPINERIIFFAPVSSSATFSTAAFCVRPPLPVSLQRDRRPQASTRSARSNAAAGMSRPRRTCCSTPDEREHPMREGREGGGCRCKGLGQNGGKKLCAALQSLLSNTYTHMRHTRTASNRTHLVPTFAASSAGRMGGAPSRISQPAGCRSSPAPRRRAREPGNALANTPEAIRS